MEKESACVVGVMETCVWGEVKEIVVVLEGKGGGVCLEETGFFFAF